MSTGSKVERARAEQLKREKDACYRQRREQLRRELEERVQEAEEERHDREVPKW